MGFLGQGEGWGYRAGATSKVFTTSFVVKWGTPSMSVGAVMNHDQTEYYQASYTAHTHPSMAQWHRVMTRGHLGDGKWVYRGFSKVTRDHWDG